MSKFIITKEELNTYFKFSDDVEVSTIDNHLLTVESDFILAVLGQTFFDEVLAAYEDQTATSVQNSLIKNIQNATVELAAWLSIDDFNVAFSSAGLVVVVDKESGIAPASEARTEKLRESLKRRGFKSIDRMITFLEINKTDFPTWTSSDEYGELKQYFINTTAEFNQACNQNVTQFMFIKILPFINQIEQSSILTAICDDLFNEIKTQIAADTISAENETLLRRIRPAIANLAFSMAIIPLGITLDGFGLTMYNNTSSGSFRGAEPPDNALILNMKSERENDGKYWLNQLSNYLKNNPDTYPLYKNSPCFIDTTADDYTSPGVKVVDGGVIT